MVWFDSCALFDVIRWLKPSSPDKYVSAFAYYYYTSHVMLIYTCVTPCIFTCNYLWCLNACQWRCGLQTIFRTWLTLWSILFNYLIDGYCHLLFICYTLITQYYHNITQLDVKCLHLIRYITLPNRWPPPSLNHNKTLADMPTYNVLNVSSVGSFFLWNASSKQSKKRKE